jgi:VIT1/CCC1 family predicted Fe2+/Mn2+ transporter
LKFHGEIHRSGRIGWLRAAILGADDGIVSSCSLMIGVAASSASRGQTVLAGVAGLVAGAMSMAAGEYVSVSSQLDAERADTERERQEHVTSPEMELEELAGIYARRGLGRDLARTVAKELMRVDPLGSHLRDELGMSEATRARPLQAALVSAASFALGAAPGLVVMMLAPASLRIPLTAAAAISLLATLGAIGGKLGGASPGRAALRVTFGGGLAMAVTAAIGRLAGGVSL